MEESKEKYIAENKKLKQRINQLESFLEVSKKSAHMINDKLTTILGAAEVVWEGLDKKDFYCTQQIQTIIRSVDRVKMHTDDIEETIRSAYPLWDSHVKKINVSQDAPRILLAEDDRDNRNILNIMVERLGYNVELAANGDEALEIFEKFKFDLVITDIKMPKRDGLEVLKAVKKKKATIPVILITGFDRARPMKAAQNYKNVFFLRKPFRQKALHQILEEIFE